MIHCCNGVNFCVISRNKAPIFVKIPAIVLPTFSSWLQLAQAAQTSENPTRESMDLSSAVNLVVNWVAKLRIKILLRKFMWANAPSCRTYKYLSISTHFSLYIILRSFLPQIFSQPIPPALMIHDNRLVVWTCHNKPAKATTNGRLSIAASFGASPKFLTLSLCLTSGKDTKHKSCG